MEIDIHDTVKIISTKIEGHNEIFWREITFINKDGEELKINLYSHEVNTLIIKKQ